MDPKKSEKAKAIREEIRKTPYHKGTEHHLGLLKAKLAKLERERERTVGGGGSLSFAIKKQGDATCVLVGPPSSGKSTLINALTEAKSKTGEYDFTTLDVIPGMMFYRGAVIQIFDIPGLVSGASFGRGEGKKIISVVRTADLVILITDVDRIEWIEKLRNELYQAGVRLDKLPPRVEIKKSDRGGVRIIDHFANFDSKMITSIAEEFGFKNCEITFFEKLASIDDLIDVFAKDKVYLPSIEIVNKVDKETGKESVKNSRRIFISAACRIGLEELRQMIWNKLNFVSIYLKKEKNADPDFDAPLILKNKMTIIEAAAAVSLELANEVVGALVWGNGAKFPGQRVTKKHPLSDGMTVFFLKKKFTLE